MLFFVCKCACSEIIEKWTSLQLADMVTFPTIHPRWKNANMYLICKQFEKAMLTLLIVLWIVVVTFSNFQEGFSLISPKLHSFCVCYFTHSLLSLTQLWIPNLQVWKKLRDEAVDRNKQSGTFKIFVFK